MKKMCLGDRLINLNFIIVIGLFITAIFFRFENVSTYNVLLYIAFVPILLNVVLWKLRG